MCATCISSADAPPVPVLITAIKKQLRSQRRAKWMSRAFVAVFGFFVCFFTWRTFNGAPYLGVFAFLDLLLAWWMLRTAERLAYRADHTARHLRLTEALQETQ